MKQPGGQIFFVSSPDFPFFPGTGGTETFTFGMIRELQQHGIDARIVTVGQKVTDGRSQLPDIPFVDVDNERSLSGLDATLIGVVDPFIVPTKRPAFVIAHVPPGSTAYSLDRYKQALGAGHTLIANSRYAKKQWTSALTIRQHTIPVVYPFAHPAFGKVTRPLSKPGITRVLFAGRLHIHKGIFLLLEALHHTQLQKGFSFSITRAQGHDRQGAVIEQLLRAHPLINLVDATTTPEDTAELMARHDIVVVPSNHFFWQEAFGMLSVEAQHAGCRVVASNTGGLPETDVGSLHLFEPGNSLALAKAIEEAAKAGEVSGQIRRQAAKQFTVGQSIDDLLAIINQQS